MIPHRLHALFRIPNPLQHASALFQSTRKIILLLRDLGQQDTQLIADIARMFVLLLTPLAQLTCDALALATGRLVGGDLVVLRLDELVELFAEFGLLDAAEGGHGEAVAWSGGGGGGIVGAVAGALFGADAVVADDVPV